MFHVDHRRKGIGLVARGVTNIQIIGVGCRGGGMKMEWNEFQGL